MSVETAASPSPPASRLAGGPVGRGDLTGAIAGAATISFAPILVRAANVSPSTAAIFRCVYAVPLLVALVLLQRRRAGRSSGYRRWLAAMAGIALAADMITWNHSIADIGAGLSSIVGNAQVVIMPLAAWLLLAERVSRRILIMMPPAIVGVALVAGVAGGHLYGRHPTAGVLFGVASAFTYPFFILLLRASNPDRASGIEPMLVATITCACASALIGIVVGDADFVPKWPSAGWLVLLALSTQVLGWVLIARSLPRLPAAVSSLVLLIQPVGSMIWGAIIFGESPGLWQLVGAALILLSLSAIRPDPAREAI